VRRRGVGAVGDKIMNLRGFCVTSLVLAAGLASFVTAAQPQTTKSETRFEDWIVACDDGTGAKKCSVSQTFTKQGTGEVVLAWVLATNAEGKLRAIVYTPTQVLLEPGLKVEAGALTPLVAPYRYCAPQACVSEFDFSDDWLATFRKDAEYSVTFQPVNQNPATVKGSLKGFTAAYDFFAKQ
jgi:invasion protein IalB